MKYIKQGNRFVVLESAYLKEITEGVLKELGFTWEIMINGIQMSETFKDKAKAEALFDVICSSDYENDQVIYL